MSNAICIAGESGSGKTTSMRNLNPKETFYIDADKKGLCWKGWREQYNKENKNYIKTTSVEKIKESFKRIDVERPEIKTIVIDTLNGIMVSDEMRRCKETGFGKWIDLAQSVWELVDIAYNYRDDLMIIFLAHTQTEQDENGYRFTRIKTNGRKLEKISLESKFTTVLLAKSENGRHFFETHAQNSTAKTPLGAFEENEIDNDIVPILEVLKQY